MKFCRDCAHLQTFDGYFCCRAPENLYTLAPNVVTGQASTIARVPEPYECRRLEGYCGKEARWFKPRFGLVARFLNWSLVKWPALKK